MKRTQLTLIAALAAAAALATACGKSEVPGTKARANAPLQIANAEPETQASIAAANEALKERLARQEAAAKLFDKGKPEPAPTPARAEPAPARAEAAPQRQPEPAKTAAPAPAKAAEAAPPKVVEAPKAEPPKAEPVKADPSKAEPVRLASAAPTTLPAPTSLAAKLVSRVDPDFPREAVQAGVDKGNVKARMTLDGGGNVTRVEIVEALPRRVFDRAVVRALSQWRFNEGPSGRTVETEVDFKLR